MDLELLKEIGLTESETKVYLALLELGSTTKGPIVDKSAVASSKVYELLEKLIQKGLASFVVKSGTKYFEAAPPERIMDYMAEKESKLHEQKKNLEKILPELQLKRQLSKFKSEAQIFKGNKGWKTAFDDILNTLQKGEKLLITGISDFDPEFKRMIYHWHIARAKKGIKAEILINYDAKESREEFNKLPNTKVKYMQEGMVTPSVFLIYKNKTLLSLPNQRTFLRIENEEATNSFRTYFDALWNQEVQTYQGQEAVEKIYSSLIDMAKPNDDIIIFAAKPTTKRGADYNRDWNKEIRKKVKNVRLLYYGDNEINRARAKEIANQGCETRILPTQQSLPVSTIVIGNIIFNVVWGKKPIAFKIDNKAIADSYRENFEILWNQDVTVATGLDNVYDAWDRMLDELNPGEEYYVMGAADRNQNGIYDYLINFHKRRRAKKIKAKFLFASGAEEYVEKFKESYTKLGEVKYLPQGIYKGIQFNFFKNKVLMIVWRKKPTVIIINDKQVHDTFKTYFDTLWNQDVTTFSQSEGIRNAFQNLVDEMNSDEEVHIMGVHDFGEDFLPLALFFQEIRSKKGIKAKFLMNNNAKSIAEKFKKYPPLEIKFIPDNLFTPAIFIIYKNKVIINLPKEMTFFVIESKSTKESFDAYFNMMWKSAKI